MSVASRALAQTPDDLHGSIARRTYDGPPLTLNAAIDEALQRNPTLIALRGQFEAVVAAHRHRHGEAVVGPAGMVQRGPRTMFIPTARRVLEATVVLIDGRTGAALATQKLPSRVRYGLGRFSSGLALFLQHMDRAMPDWFRAIGEARKP